MNNRGREFGHAVSEETRAKISATLKARIRTEEEKAKQAANLALGRRPEAHVNRGPISDEHKAKISAALKKQGTCSIDDCPEPAKAKDLCKKHYMRLRRRGDPLAANRRLLSGAEGARWQGDNVGWHAVHLRLRKTLPAECSLADDTCKGRLEVSFRRHDTPPEFWIDDPKGPYSVNPNHYWRLCRSHHVRLDHGLLGL
jgi:hypothetical protein